MHRPIFKIVSTRNKNILIKTVQLHAFCSRLWPKGLVKIIQQLNLNSGLYPNLSRLGMQAKLIIGGGPHIKTTVSCPGGGRCWLIISSFTKPELYFQPAWIERNIHLSLFNKIQISNQPILGLQDSKFPINVTRIICFFGAKTCMTI